MYLKSIVSDSSTSESLNCSYLKMEVQPPLKVRIHLKQKNYHNVRVDLLRESKGRGGHQRDRTFDENYQTGRCRRKLCHAET